MVNLLEGFDRVEQDNEPHFPVWIATTLCRYFHPLTSSFGVQEKSYTCMVLWLTRLSTLR